MTVVQPKRKGPKGWDDPNRLNDMAHRVQSTKLRECPRGTTGKSSEAIMASLIVIALILTITGVLVGGFAAISFAISRGHHVRSVIWKVQDHTGRGARPLTGSSRRA